MSDHPDDRFDPRLSPPRAKPPRGAKFTTKVLKSLSRQQASALGAPATQRKGKGAVRGRGRVAAHQARQRFGLSSRRVTVKFRLVNLRHAGPGKVASRLRYLQRDGVRPDGEKGQLYSASLDAAEASDFERRCRGDRHQFAVIVSPDEGAEIGDLRAFTRSLMSQVERDLGTHLDWVAADHFDTGHPHTHLIIRGRGDDGKDLVISRDYISNGMRMRASELSTRWLGPRTPGEIDADFNRQVSAERWTGLDTQISRLSDDGHVQRVALQERFDATMAARSRARLAVLEGMGLAQRTPTGWMIDPSARTTLQAMGERGDIIRELQRLHSARQYEIFDPHQAGAGLVGRVAARGWHEESDRGYVLIESLDGRQQYVALPSRIDPNDLPASAILSVKPVEARFVDRTVVKVADQGVYRPAVHQQKISNDRSITDPDEFVQSHLRRLEALRRAGIVERVEEGVWRIPSDMAERALAYDRRRLGGMQVEVLSSIAIERQVRTLGPTWLDRQLIENTMPPESSFGQELRRALHERGEFLIARGYASRQGQRFVLARNLLEQLREREISDAATRLEATHGLIHRPIASGERISGTYRRNVDLVSGRYAMLDDGVGFSLVPWRPVIADRMGQSLSATISGGRVSWELGRQRGLSL